MAQSFTTNLSNVAVNYMQLLKLPVTKTTLKNNLEENPYYPSLFSISTVFSRFKIDNQAFEIDSENLQQFQPPFIAYLDTSVNGKDFVLVTKTTGTMVNYIAGGSKTKTISKEIFLKGFQKIVFVAEGNAQSGEKAYAENLQKEKKLENKNAALIGGGVLLLLLIIFQFFNTLTVGAAATALLTITKLSGLAIAVLLLIYEVDKTNSFVKNICAAGKQTNCDAVLNSKSGKIAGISWGEAGFFYFAATALFLLLPGIAFTNKLPLLAIAATAVAPYIVFSIYYQWKVVKQWCPLCLAIQIVLAMELSWSIVNFWINNDASLQSSLSPSPWGRIGGAVLLPFLAWYTLKPILLAAKAAPGYNAAYKRLLYNPDTFNSLLQQQIAAPAIDGLGISIGNPNAKSTIIKVCNPYCGPCAKAHPVLEEIIQHNPDINVRIIFTATNKENDRGAAVVKHLLAIQAQNNLQQTQKALDDWYLAPKKDYEVFAKKYPLHTNGNSASSSQQSPAFFPPSEGIGEAIEAMSKWCNKAEIMHTPTIFINGRLLPETYSITELKHIL